MPLLHPGGNTFPGNPLPILSGGYHTFVHMKVFSPTVLELIPDVLGSTW